MQVKSLAEVATQNRAPSIGYEPFESEPSDDQVRRKYEALFVHGREKGNDAWSWKPWMELDYLQFTSVATRAVQRGLCCGPRFKDYRSRGGRKAPVRTCRSRQCPFCWMMRMHTAKVKGLLRHVGAESAFKFSMTLPAVRDDPERVRKARDCLFRQLRRWGYTGVSLYVHVFGEDMRGGPKGHLDGVASRLDGGGDAVDLQERMESLLAGYCEPWSPYAEVRQVEPRREDQKGELTRHQGLLSEIGLGLMYAGRDTLRTDRLWAGQYRVGRSLAYRVLPLSMTRRDVGGLEGESYYMTAGEVAEAWVDAQAWRAIIPRPAYTRTATMVDRRHARDLVRECASSVFYRASLPLEVLRRARRR